MNLLKGVSALTFGVLLLAASSARATTIRTGSDYGTQSGASQPVEIGGVDVGTQWVFTYPPASSTFDVILQINPLSTDLGDPLEVTFPLAAGGSFGLIDCSSPGNLGNDGSDDQPCNDGLAASVSGTPCDLSDVTYTDGSVILPGSCDVAGETFFFDIGSSTAFATVSLAGAAVTPEPSSLAMLGIALILLVFLSRQRQQAKSCTRF